MWKWMATTVLGRLAAVVVGLGIAYIALVRPDWAMGPPRWGIEQVMLGLGAGAGPVVLWVAAFFILLRYRPKLLLRSWRLVLGSAGLVVTVLGVLAYFNGSLLLVDYGSLGGEFGEAVQGQIELFSYVRVLGLGLLSVWVMLPQHLGRLVIQRTVRAFGHGLLLPVRALRRVRRWRREARGAPTGLAEDLGHYLVTSQRLTGAGLQATGRDPRKRLPAPSSRLVPKKNKDAQALPESRGEEPEAENVPSMDKDGNWDLPPLALLQRPAPVVQVSEEHLATARLIEETLAQHQVEVQVVEIRPGPTVTLFGLVPGWVRRRKAGDGSSWESRDDANNDPNRSRVKVDAVVARERDMALALAAPSLRIQAPVPGESVIGIEVPNKHASTVVIRSVMESEAYDRLLERGVLPVALGQASAGEAVAIDLVNMPHLLIAGATGSGKSVCLNSIIASLIIHQQPSKVRLLLVDPKRVELTPYNGIPHLATPVMVDPERVVRLFKGVIQEMLRRYRVLEEAGVRNIQSYNTSLKSAQHPIPYLVICIDELADLMMAASYEVEQSICRLAQLGRATGIHLVVATQRPSVDVVTGLIKANFPTRISFAVASQVDSRTILDMAGAERLLGRGDMLFLSRESAKPRRVQGVFISEEETEALARHWRLTQGHPVAPMALEEMAQVADVAVAGAQLDNEDNEPDSLFEKALDLAIRNGQVSTSLLQRRLRIGYPRAARLMDQLEGEGVVGPSSEPGKPRDVLSVPQDQPLAGAGPSL